MNVKELLREMSPHNIVQYYWGGSYSMCLTASECMRRFLAAAPREFEVKGTPEIKDSGVLLFDVQEIETPAILPELHVGMVIHRDSLDEDYDFKNQDEHLETILKNEEVPCRNFITSSTNGTVITYYDAGNSWCTIETITRPTKEDNNDKSIRHVPRF